MVGLIGAAPRPRRSASCSRRASRRRSRASAPTCPPSGLAAASPRPWSSPLVVGVVVTLDRRARRRPSGPPGSRRSPRCATSPSSAPAPPRPGSSSACVALALGAFNLTAGWRGGSDTEDVPVAGFGAVLVIIAAHRRRPGAGRPDRPGHRVGLGPVPRRSPAAWPSRTRPAARSAPRPRRRRSSSAWRWSASSTMFATLGRGVDHQRGRPRLRGRLRGAGRRRVRRPLAVPARIADEVGEGPRGGGRRRASASARPSSLPERRQGRSASSCRRSTRRSSTACSSPGWWRATVDRPHRRRRHRRRRRGRGPRDRDRRHDHDPRSPAARPRDVTVEAISDEENLLGYYTITRTTFIANGAAADRLHGVRRARRRAPTSTT